jgi:membrane protein DedA with SNARE-associated domain
VNFTNSSIPASFWLLLLYIFLLSFSWTIQLTFTEPDTPRKYQKTERIEFNGDTVDINYLLIGGERSTSVSFYLPDIYHGADYLIPLAESDTSAKSRIIFEYPLKTLNGSDLSLSVESRAEMASIFIDSLNIVSLSIRGHGYGGLPAMDMISNLDQSDYRINSLVLLTSFGVQELQFLGNYSFNKTIYSILHGVMKVSEYIVPHMGYFYQQPFQDHYTKPLLEMDQREVRNELSEIDLPVLIIHPSDDHYISKTISQETHRLVPQSYFISPNGSHHTYFSNPDLIAEHLNWFSELTESGCAVTRNNASEKRLSESRKEFDPDSIQNLSRSTLALLGFMVVLIATLSEDLGAISAGLLVASGLLPYWYAIMVTILGIFIVDVSIYFLGKYIGRPIIEKVPFRWFIKEKDVASAENTFNMRGVEIIFLARFLPGARLPVYLVAGILKVNFTFFLTYFFLAISIWAPLLIWLSAFIGEPILGYINTYQNYALWVFIGLMFLIYLFVKLIVPLTTLKGRQRLVIKWRRFRDRFQ